MSQNKVRAIRYEVQQVGKRIKGSKKRFLWVAAIGDRVYNFILDDSVVSGKSKLSINGKVFHEIQQPTLRRCKYNHSFTIQGCLFNIIEMEEGYEMRINNNLFSHLLHQQMKLSSFSDHKVEENSFNFDQNFKATSNKKVTLNIAGMANFTKKKKGVAVQSDNWQNFVGEASEFPNFFDKAYPTQQKLELKKSQQNKFSCQAKQIPAKKGQQSKLISSDNKIQLQTLDSKAFTTLQNLFQTINQSAPYIPEAGSSTPTYNVTEIPIIPEINLTQFNTMQNMFRTNPIYVDQLKTQSVQSKFEDFPFSNHPSKLQTKQTEFDSFNNIQNASDKKQSEKKNQNNKTIVNKQETGKIDFTDFSTIQNLFSTNKLFQKQSKLVEQQSFSDIYQDNLAKNCVSLDISNQTHLRSEPKDTQLAHPKKTDTDDFNTMQNLFQTNFFPVNQKVLTLSKQNALSQPQQTPKQIQKNVSFEDFNTIQNLFQTTQNIQKKQNSFWQFQS